MIVKRQDVRNLCKSLSEKVLVEMAGVVVKIGMCHILLVVGSPLLVLSIFLALRVCPLVKRWYILPKPVGVDLVT